MPSNTLQVVLQKLIYSRTCIYNLQKKRDRLYQTLLEAIHKLVPKRIGCSEPRVCKRHPKAYPLMQQSRQVLRQKGCAA